MRHNEHRNLLKTRILGNSPNHRFAALEDTHRRLSSFQINMLANTAFHYWVLSHAPSRCPK
jgi:hypothetical protein